MLSELRYWIPLAIVITVVCGLVYLSVQQNIRQSANDPQIQMAEDAATSLNSGKDLVEFIPASRIDISKSLAPFIIIFDNATMILATNALLEAIPNPPAGVFEFVKAHGSERLTWQPNPETRIAAVIVKYNNGFVLAGRNLREVENRVEVLGIKVAIAWIVTLVTSLLATLILISKNSKK